MQTNSRINNALKNAKLALILKLLVIVMQFALQTVFIYTLGKQYAGVAGLFTDILLMLSLTELGIGSAVQFSLYEPLAVRDGDKITRYMNYIKNAYRVIFIAIIGAGLITLPFLKYIITDIPNIKENIAVIFIIFILKTAVSYLFIYKSVLLTSDQRNWIISRINIIFAVISTAIGVFILLMYGNYLLYLVVDVIINICKNIVVSKTASNAYKDIFRKSNLKLSHDERKRMKRDIGALFIYRVARVVSNGTDSIIISVFMGTPFIGVLVNYRMITNAIYDLFSQVFYATIPGIGNVIVKESAELQYEIYQKMNFLMFCLTCFCTTSLFNLLTPFLSIWLGENYLFTFGVMTAIVVNFYIDMMMQVNSSFRNGCGLFVQGKWCPLYMTIINIALSILGAKTLGLIGIFFATGISRLLTQVWYDPVLLYRNIFKKNIKKFFISYLIYALLTLSSCFVSYRLISILHLENKYALFLVSIFICIAISLMFICVPFHKTKEFKYFCKLLKNTICEKHK